MLFLIAPTCFLAVRSPLLLVAVPTLLWRFWSTNGFYWGTAFQYSAVLMPIVFVAALDALSRMKGTRIARFAPATMAGVAVAATLLAPLPLRGLADPASWRIDPAVSSANRLLAMIPDGATVAADNRLAPQLTARCTVFLFPGHPNGPNRPEWVVYTEPYHLSMATEESIDAALARLRADYYTAAQEGGTTVLRRR